MKLEPIQIGKGYQQHHSCLVKAVLHFQPLDTTETIETLVVVKNDSEALTLAETYLRDSFRNFTIERIWISERNSVVLSDTVYDTQIRNFAEVVEELEAAKRTIADLEKGCDVRGILPIQHIEAMIKQLQEIVKEQVTSEHFTAVEPGDRVKYFKDGEWLCGTVMISLGHTATVSFKYLEKETVLTVPTKYLVLIEKE